MSDQDNLTVAVQIATRARMNTGTPRFGPWTYHHVLPVRLYFMAAWTMIRIAKHPECWKSTQSAARVALSGMCNNGANEARLRLYLDKKEAEPDEEDLRVMASLCASPPGGGFGGPNPGQRLTDPEDQPERMKPASASANWYYAIFAIETALKDAYNFGVMPAPNSRVQATQKIMNWCYTVETLAGYVKAMTDLGPHQFNEEDWILGSGKPWHLTRGPAYNNGTNVPLRLRGATEPVTFVAADKVLPAGGVSLRRKGDYIQSQA